MDKHEQFLHYGWEIAEEYSDHVYNSYTRGHYLIMSYGGGDKLIDLDAGQEIFRGMIYNLPAFMLKFNIN